MKDCEWAGARCRSPGSAPAIASRATAASRTVRVSTPSHDMPAARSPKSGPIETRPRLGLRPTTPQQDAGMRIEPPRSLPSARPTRPAETAAALPPDDPPADRSGFHGLHVAPNRRFSVTGRNPSSGEFVLPTTIAPASRSRRTWALSWSATQSPNAWLPSVVGVPSVAESRSLIPTGTPQSGRRSPGRTASASSSARSAHSVTNAFSLGCGARPPPARPRRAPSRRPRRSEPAPPARRRSDA